MAGQEAVENKSRGHQGARLETPFRGMTRTISEITGMVEKAGIAQTPESMRTIDDIARYVLEASQYPIFDGAILTQEGDHLRVLAIVEGEPIDPIDMVRAAELRKFGRKREAAKDPGVQSMRLTELSMGLLIRGVGYSKVFASMVGERPLEEVVRDFSQTDIPLGKLAPIR